MGAEAANSSIVPATPEALLQLILSLEEPEDVTVLSSNTKKKKSSDDELASDRVQHFPLRVAALTSAVWLISLVVLGVTHTSQIQRQDQRLQQLIERIEPKHK